MNTSIQTIGWLPLAIAFLPVFVVVAVLFRWAAGGGIALLAVARMLLQLWLVGFVLKYIFLADQSWVVVVVLTVMLVAAGWIALRPLHARRLQLYRKSLAAIALGGGATLLLVTQGVLQLDPWFKPQFMVPLAGMIFANAMNTVSLAGERLFSELDRGMALREARATALRAALIPLVNSFLAVGLVSIPGMMTGQMLSGISPEVAARYQVMVMCMVFGASGLSTILFLSWVAKDVPPESTAADDRSALQSSAA